MNSVTFESFDTTSDPVQLQVEQIRNSGILARSGHLKSLFEYLYQCYLADRIPKELEIAMEGMGKDASFDASQDALVRVYVHKLRRKLDEFYANEGEDERFRLDIPKGEYRLVLQAGPKVQQKYRFDHPLPIRLLLLLTLLLSLTVNIFFWLYPAQNQSSAPQINPLWQPLFADTKAITLVIGDYYLFAESDGAGQISRLVRQFDVNSAADLANQLQLDPELAAHQFDLGLSYIPTSAARALNAISPVLQQHGKEPKVVMASELNADLLQNSHLVYVGQLSGLGQLADLLFDQSGFQLGAGYDELVDKTTQQRFSSSNGIPAEHGLSVAHLAYLSSFTGPSGNRIIIASGFRDQGLNQLTELLKNETSLAKLDSSRDFEALFKSTSTGAVHKPAQLLLQRPIPKQSTGN